MRFAPGLRQNARVPDAEAFEERPVLLAASARAEGNDAADPGVGCQRCRQVRRGPWRGHVRLRHVAAEVVVGDHPRQQRGAQAEGAVLHDEQGPGRIEEAAGIQFRPLFRVKEKDEWKHWVSTELVVGHRSGAFLSRLLCAPDPGCTSGYLAPQLQALTLQTINCITCSKKRKK